MKFMTVVWAVLVAGLISLALLTGPGESYSSAERLAIRLDAVLDTMDPPKVTKADLVHNWPREIAPYFEYEGFTSGWKIPKVRFFKPTDALEHNHLYGYTWCDDEIAINERATNPVSRSFEVPVFLATLTHEMLHTQGGAFCLPGNSPRTESNTETATNEVLAALANHGNKVAFYTALDNLMDITVSVAWWEALQNKDIAHFRRFLNEIYSPTEVARIEKSMRFWADKQRDLKDILFKYSVIVLRNIESGKLRAAFPQGFFGNTQRTVLLDDINYLIEHFEEMAEEAQ